MSILWQRPAFAGLAGPGLRQGSRAGLGAVATALARTRHWLERFDRNRHRPPSGNGGSEPPEEHRRNDSIWDDPELWMLMIH
jgi:hypothetical protein